MGRGAKARERERGERRFMAENWRREKGKKASGSGPRG